MTPGRRLLALGALSAALHLLVLGLVVHRADLRAVGLPEAPPAPLALRLQHAQKAAPAAVPVVPAPVPAPLPPAPARHATAPSAAPTPAAPAAAPASEATAGRPAAPVSDTPGETDWGQMPGRYRSRMPPSATLTYALVRAGAAPAEATLRWRTDRHTYTMEADGVTGKLSASGGTSDAGVAPRTATGQRAGGGAVDTTFGENEIVIDGRIYPNNVGSQDRASLLLQLVGMALAEPDQIRNVIDIYVAGERETEIQKFEVAEEEEQVATPIGTFATRHLVQQVRTGAPRLEIWLAPAQRWLPVMLRVTGADGTVSTQTVTRIE